ncbi:hypothetical protein KKB10_05655 [Patescibacteria group bacterium]|nr:hypothetical protein [Patescibacteria group bacterium]MBU1074848.1 hypothetical protein [Patescibacteria group bacterium]MBU1951824.1 hypothetical protein [Patescibacteria group bacterium]
MKYKKVLAILLWTVRGVSIGLSLWLFISIFNHYFIPLGKLEVTYDFSDDSEYISHLEPWQRLLPPEEVNGDWFQAMKDDLVYFDVKIPRWFQAVAAEITFKNSSIPIFELGAKADKAGNYISAPLQNKLIDELDWVKTDDEGIGLLQKYEKYADIQSFISSPPQNKMIGEYYYHLNPKKLFPNYIKSNRETIIDRKLRGSHTIYTYIKDEEFNLSIYKFDLNRYAGMDGLEVEVFKQENGEKVYSGKLPDDGDDEITGSFQSEQNISIMIPNLAEGVYRIELIGNSDTVISKIVTKQHLLVFSRNLFPIDNDEYFKELASGSKQTDLFTNSSIITFKTSHPTGIQNVLADNQILEVKELNKDFKFLNNKGTIKLKVPNNDLSISFNGFMAFEENQYFNPLPDNIVGITSDTDINTLDYIIYNYSQPKTENEWLVSSASFDISRLYKNNDDNIRFRLSAPKLNEVGDVINISKIKITYEKPPVTLKDLPGKIVNHIKNLFAKN